MSYPNYKQAVKAGQMTPEQALERMLNEADNQEQAANSRTARWLRSPNAQKRYQAARARSKA